MRALLAILLVACGAEHPPFASLPLRDSLLAPAKALAHLDAAERSALRERFVLALAEGDSDLRRVANDDAPAWIAFDRAREDAGLDVAPRITLSAANDATEVSRVFVRFVAEAKSDTALSFDEGGVRDDADTAELIEQALSGAAGALLQRLRAGLALVRADNAPFAIASDQRALYVNPAWLVVMAEASGDSAVVSAPIKRSALSVGTVSSIDGCESEVRAQCGPCVMDAAACEGAIVLADYQTTQSECTAVAGGGNVARNICQALALSREDVLQCVTRNAPACVAGLGVRSNGYFDQLNAKQNCTTTLARCALDPKYYPQISCDACTNTCNNICRPTINCTPSCSSSSSTGSSSCASCNGSKLCAAATPPGHDAIPELSIACGLLPLFYFARRARRRR